MQQKSDAKKSVGAKTLDLIDSHSPHRVHGYNFFDATDGRKTQVSMSKPKQARIDNQWLIDANSTAVSSLHCSCLMLRDGAPPEAQLEASYPCEQGDRPQLLACLCTITQANLNLHNHQRATILRAGLTVREMPSKIFRVHIPGPRRRPATRQST